jgi:hypothetical protein
VPLGVRIGQGVASSFDQVAIAHDPIYCFRHSGYSSYHRCRLCRSRPKTTDFLKSYPRGSFRSRNSDCIA